MSHEYTKTVRGIKSGVGHCAGKSAGARTGAGKSVGTRTGAGKSTRTRTGAGKSTRTRTGTGKSVHGDGKIIPGSAGKIRIAPEFCLLALWFGIANGWRTLVIVLWTAAVHESGHILALALSGAKITGFHLGICGAVLRTDCARLSYGRELCAVLAGPLANLLFAAALCAEGNHWPVLTGANLVLCAYNLLPARPLDGGRALFLLLSWGMGPAAGERLTRAIGTVTAGGMAAALVFVMWKSGGSLWLLPAVTAMTDCALRELRGK